MTRKQYDTYEHQDIAFQLFCSQIESDYTTILRRDILPQLDVSDSIRLREMRTLMTLDYLAKPASCTQIADFLRFDRGTVSRAVKNLKLSGYVKRQPGREDRRSPPLIITKSGKLLAKNYQSLTSDHFSTLSKAAEVTFSKKESKVALETLFKLRNRARELANVDVGVELQTSAKERA